MILGKMRMYILVGNQSVQEKSITSEKHVMIHEFRNIHATLSCSKGYEASVGLSKKCLYTGYFYNMLFYELFIVTYACARYYGLRLKILLYNIHLLFS